MRPKKTGNKMQNVNKILVVDDDEYIVEILNLSLQTLGYDEVSTAHCAAEALYVVDEEAEPFDCILLDIQMPDTNGIELCEILRKIPAYQKTPIIMLTAMSDRVHIDDSFAAGATDYITKPFEILDLKARLDVASRLNAEVTAGKQAESKLDALTEELILGGAVNLHESIEITDLKCYLNSTSFMNYLRQLDRGKLRFAEIVAVKIADIDLISDEMRSFDYVNYITDVAEGISDNLFGGNCHFTYVGNGCFVIVNLGPEQAILNDNLHTLIEQTVERMGLVYRNGGQIVTRLSQSNVYQPGIVWNKSNEQFFMRVCAEVDYQNEDEEGELALSHRFNLASLHNLKTG